MLSPNDFVLIIFFLLVICSIVQLLTRKPRAYLGMKLLLPLVVLSLIAKFPVHGNFFFGLEYEDAYVYNSYARFLLYNPDTAIDPFLTKGCLIGSLRDCQAIGTYSGHLIGLPSIVYLFFKFFGYTPYAASIINLICALISTILIFHVSRIIVPQGNAFFYSTFVYALTPIMNLFHTTSLSETCSSTFILLSLLLYLSKTTEQDTSSRLQNVTSWINIALAVFFACLIKRENLILLSLPFLTILLSVIEKRRVTKVDVLPLLPFFAFSAVIIFFHFGYINLYETVNVENAEAKGVAFHWSYFLDILPAFIKSFFAFQWFSVFSFFLFGSLIIFFRRFYTYRLLLYPVALFFFYLILYSVHYRSYYFVHTGAIHEFDTLRYIANLFPFYAILVGFCLGKSGESLAKLAPPSKYPALKAFRITLICLFIGFTLFQSYVIRETFAGVEKVERLAPITETLKVLRSNRDVILTDEPLLFQLFGPDNLFVIDLHCLGKEISESYLRELVKQTDVYYLKKAAYDTELDITRNPGAFDIASKFRKQKIQDDLHGGRFTIFLLRNQDQ